VRTGPFPLFAGDERGGLDGLNPLALQPADVGLAAVQDDEPEQPGVLQHVFERFGEGRGVAVVPERFDGLGRRLQRSGDHVGLAAAGVDRSRKDHHPVFRREGVVVPEAVLDRGERVLDGRPGLLGLDVGRLAVFLCDVGDHVGDLPILGDVDGDELRSGALEVAELPR